MSKRAPLLSLSQAAEQRTNRTVETISAQMNRDLGEGTVVRASDVIAPPRRLSTGSLWFDLSLGGGWPQNAWSEIVGLESSGKTALAYATIATGMRRDSNFTALWCAAEPFDAQYAKDIGVDLSRLWLFEENTMEIVYEKVSEYVIERAVDIAVIDAYPSLITDAEDKALMGDVQVSPGARLTNKFMRKATKATKRSLIDPSDRPFTGLFINQWRDKITMFGDPRTTPGGKGKNFWMAARVEVSRNDWIKDSEGYDIGQSIKMNVFKNKSSPPRREGKCDFYFDNAEGHHIGEFDHPGEVMALCTELGVVERKGNTYWFGDTKLATTKGQLEAMLRSEEDLCRRVAAAIRHKELGEPVEKPKVAPRYTPRSRRAA